MPKAMTEVLGRLVNGVREFTVAQRTIAIIGVAVLVVGVVALGAWLSRSNYSPLFSGLSGSDASAIVDQLQTNGVPYQLADGGATILVPDDKVNQERLAAASAGLPSLDNGGYALLDSMAVTTSEFQQSVTYKRAIEGELASTIGSIDGVQTASVQLALPKESVFVSQQADPTASVFIETNAGKTLATDQVRAITHLVSAAIDGLKPENVAVVSADGTVLSAVGVGATGSTDQQASTYEGRVQAAVQTMLDRVMGPGNATVVVAATMSLQTAQRVEESFTTPEGAPALTEERSTERTGGAAGTGAGVLGPDSIAVPATGAGDGATASETVNRTNAVNKVTETTSTPAGQIERQTVSVAVNKDAGVAMSAPQIESLVAAAAGIDAARGDTVNVALTSFGGADGTKAAAALAEARAQELQTTITSIVAVVAPVLGVILVAIIVMSGIRSMRRRRDEEGELDLGELAASRADSLLSALPEVPKPGALPAAAPFAPTPELFAAGGDDAQRMRQELDSLAAADPERTAETLRALMSERSGV